MANAQVLILVRGSSGLSPDAIREIVEQAGRSAGFAPGPWSANQQTVQIAPAADGGVVVGGPWDGDTVGETVPAGGLRLIFTAYRQNFLNGPEPTAVPAGSWPFPTTAVGAALRAKAGVTSTRIAFRSPTNSISWDRGIPAPIELPASGGYSGTGMFWGLLAIAGLAYAASKGTAGASMLGKLSTNGEGLTFEEWRRAAGVSSSTPGAHVAWVKGEDPSEWRATARAVTIASRTRLRGFNGTPAEHAAQAEYLFQQVKFARKSDKRMLLTQALQESMWVQGREGERLRDKILKAQRGARR